MRTREDTKPASQYTVNELVKEVYWLAKKRTGWTHKRLCEYVSGNVKFRQYALYTRSQFSNVKKYMCLADLAGIPRSIAIIFWTVASIPAEYADAKKYVATTLNFHDKDRWKKRRKRDGDVLRSDEEMRKEVEAYVKGKIKFIPHHKPTENQKQATGTTMKEFQWQNMHGLGGR
jgi:hypothetical protein